MFLLHISLTNSCLLFIVQFVESDTVSSVSETILMRDHIRELKKKTAFDSSIGKSNFLGTYPQRQPWTSLRTSVRVPALYACAIRTALGCGSVAGTRGGGTRNIRNTRSVER